MQVMQGIMAVAELLSQSQTHRDARN